MCLAFALAFVRASPGCSPNTSRPSDIRRDGTDPTQTPGAGIVASEGKSGIPPKQRRGILESWFWLPLKYGFATHPRAPPVCCIFRKTAPFRPLFLHSSVTSYERRFSESSHLALRPVSGLSRCPPCLHRALVRTNRRETAQAVRTVIV